MQCIYDEAESTEAGHSMTNMSDTLFSFNAMDFANFASSHRNSETLSRSFGESRSYDKATGLESGNIVGQANLNTIKKAGLQDWPLRPGENVGRGSISLEQGSRVYYSQTTVPNNQALKLDASPAMGQHGSVGSEGIKARLERVSEDRGWPVNHVSDIGRRASTGTGRYMPSHSGLWANDGLRSAEDHVYLPSRDGQRKSDTHGILGETRMPARKYEQWYNGSGATGKVEGSTTLEEITLNMAQMNMYENAMCRHTRPTIYGAPGVGEPVHSTKHINRPASTGQQSDHKNSTMASRPTSTHQCRFFYSGYCKHGDKCKFSHGTAEANTNSQTRPSPPYQSGTRRISDVSRFSGLQRNPRLAPDRRWSWSGDDQESLDHGMEAWVRDGMITLESLKGHFVQLCKDQHGCRFLQGRMEKRAWCDAIYQEVLPHLASLMIDPFGNYLCQKLVECCSAEQLQGIVEGVAPSLVSVALNIHGTRAAQKLVEHLADGYQIELVVRALQGHVVTLIKDLNGNHVVQRCLQCLPPPGNQFICDAVAQYCVEVATHRHGCCVMQRCIDYASERQQAQLVTEVTFNALTLIQDAYGNYVVQYVLELGMSRFSDVLVRRFLGNVSQLAIQKFSSNVIEKCLRVAERDTFNSLVDELMDQMWLPRLLQDPFGNYVIQTALTIAEGQRYIELVEGIRPYLNLIGHLPYGKKIQYKIAKDDLARANQAKGRR